MPMLVVPNTDKSCQEDFPKAFFKVPSEIGNEQLLRQSAMHLTLCQLKIFKKAMLKEIVSSTDNIDN